MEIQINTTNIKLSPEEYILLFGLFREEQQEKIFKSLYLNFLKSEWESTDLELTEEDVSEKETEGEISDETKALLDERLDAYAKHPDKVTTWDEMKESINKKYGYGI